MRNVGGVASAENGVISSGVQCGVFDSFRKSYS